MDISSIVYRQSMPFYPVTFPVNEADGLVVEDLQLQQLVEYINNNVIKSAYICAMESYNFLKECTTLEHIVLELKLLPKHYSSLEKKGSCFLKEYDISPLYNLEKLKSLSIIDLEESYIKSKMRIDLSKFENLEKFSGDSKYVSNLEKSKKIKSLRLNAYKKDSLCELTALSELDTLEINASKIKSLDGCEQLINLQCLYLNYNKSLCDISDLIYAKNSLRALRICNCGKIKDFSVLEELENLELLELCGSNEIPDLAFINKMKSLKTFVFSVNVLNGDLTPCLNIEYVFCEKGRKHYNYRDNNLPKGEYFRGNDNIEMWRRFE